MEHFKYLHIPQRTQAKKVVRARTIKNQKPKNLLIDFTGVKFFSSQALGILLDAKKKLSALKGNVIISGINPQLYRVFKITNLDKIFKFYPDAKAAISDLKKLQKSN